MTPSAAVFHLTLLGSALVTCGVPPQRAHPARAMQAPAGDGDTALASAIALTASTQASRQRKAEVGRAPFMLSPFGAVAPPAPEALPQDESVRTRGGLYATRQQAEELDRQLGGAVAWVDVDCCGDMAIERAQYQAAGMMAALNLPDDAPVFVTGAEPALAARAVDALADQGLTRVFLVAR